MKTLKTGFKLQQLFSNWNWKLVHDTSSKVLLSNNCGSIQIKLILYTKKNCSLCDKAKFEIEEMYPNRFVFEEVDITKNRDLFRKFKFDIPVFYFKEFFLMQHKVNKDALDSLIKNLEKPKI